MKAPVTVEEEGLRGAEGKSACVGTHLIIVGSEHVEQLELIHELGDVEVGDFEAQAVAFVGHQDVPRLEVPVDDAVLVEVHDAAQQLSEQPAGHRLC